MDEEYGRRLGLRTESLAQTELKARLSGNVRLALVVAAVALGWLNPWLLPVPVAIFVALLIWHERLDRALALDRRAISFYQRGQARLAGAWASRGGEDGSTFRAASHPYSGDLDIFGPGSLFHLLDSARTRAGEATLARWLAGPSERDEVIARQEAVKELAGRLDLREDLALLGEDVRAGLHVAHLVAWGAAPSEAIGAGQRVAALVLSVALLTTFSGYMLNAWPLWPVLVVALLELGFFASVRPALMRILGGMELAGRDLGILAGLVERVEREEFFCDRLRGIKARLRTGGLPAAARIAQLRRLITYRDQARNQMFAIIAEPLLWSPQFAFAIEAWRRTSGPHLAEWLDAMGELEAIASLAGFAAEHPEYVFPELVDSVDPLYHAEGVAHPLLGPGAVANDVRLDSGMRLLLVSGSNMSGKSTLMRSVGINAVLAWAGAPVRAAALRISPVSVAASMRVQDSLMEGASRFYAEITRLRQVVDLAGGRPPLLFLLDEVLSGTNSHDRLIGAEAVVRTLVGKGSIGLVTTHDLALAHIAEELAPLAANVHFEDHIEDGKIAFDFRMRPGVVRKSNALELMRSVGLDV